jgi:hypothetical protein
MVADEFRQHGIVTSGIADLMAAVGLTHGGFTGISNRRNN